MRSCLFLRFAGKKHVGQLAPFDLVVLLILSETAQNSLIGDDTSLVGVRSAFGETVLPR